MSTIQELITEVIAETRRANRTDDITNYVKAAVRTAHSLTDFRQDLVDVSIAVTGGVAVTIGSADLPTDFRKEEIIRPLSEGAFIAGVRFKYIKPQYIVELSAAGKTENTYYITKDTLHFESATAISSFRLMYYAYPDFSDLNTDTWITRNYPEGLKDFAKARLYAALGDLDTSRRLMAHWQSTAQDIINSNE